MAPWRTRTPRHRHAHPADHKNHMPRIHEAKKSPDLELHGHKKAWAKRERQGKGTRAARGRGEEEGEISILRWMSSKSP